MVHPITEHVYITPSRMTRRYQRDYELLMAHTFFAILEREPDFLTLVDQHFPYTQSSFAGTGKMGIYDSSLDLRYFDRSFTAVVSSEAASSLSLFDHIQARLGTVSAFPSRYVFAQQRDMTDLFDSNIPSRAALISVGTTAGSHRGLLVI
jgi:hypothetical protein